jgi:GNAT superfamily N-acetyltransferase
MSWASLSGANAPVVRESAAESERFGLAIARLDVADGVDPVAGLEQVSRAIQDDLADVIVLRYPARHVGWFAALHASGRDLLHADTLGYWALRVGDGRQPPTHPETVVHLEPILHPRKIDEFMSAVFRDYNNHYAANPLFDRTLALAGYREWARRSASAGGTVAVTADGTAGSDLTALATTTSHPATADSAAHTEIELAGVLPGHQRRGLYATLLSGCEQLATTAGSSLVTISTQTHNTSVQRAWTRYGFEPVTTFTTVHVLRPGLLRRS